MSKKITLYYPAIICMMACLTLLLTVGGADITYAAASDAQRVFDGADLFTDEETGNLENRLSAVIDEINMDLAILTTDDVGGKSTEQYSDDFYEENGLGFGTDHSGAVCVIDMDNRQLYISTEGAMIRILTDDRLEDVIDNAIGYVGDGEYAQGAESMLADIRSYALSGIEDGQYNYDRDTGEIDVYHKLSITWYELLFALAAAGALGFLPCVSTVKQYRMESQRRQAVKYHMAYRGESAFAFTVTNDLLLNRAVTQRRIPRNDNNMPGGAGGRSSAGRSTVHRSSSGRTHGGGGRGF